MLENSNFKFYKIIVYAYICMYQTLFSQIFILQKNKHIKFILKLIIIMEFVLWLISLTPVCTILLSRLSTPVKVLVVLVRVCWVSGITTSSSDPATEPCDPPRDPAGDPHATSSTILASTGAPTSKSKK
jgi:hypothetical protein